MGELVREKVNRALDAVVVAIWQTIENFIYEVGAVMTFGFYSMKSFFSRPYRYTELVQQLEFIGNKSIFIITIL